MGQIVGISNPNGQQGLGWRCLSDDRFHNYMYNWLAKPDNTLEEYLFHKNRLPPYRFASIFAATYMTVEGGFITFDQYNKFASFDFPLIIPQKANLFLGGDFSAEDPKYKTTDWSVLYGVILIPNTEKGFMPRVRIVYMKEWKPRTPKEEIYNELRRLQKTTSIPRFAYDRIGVGDKVKNDLIDRGIFIDSQIEPLTYSLPNKSDVYLNFQSLFEHGMIEGRDIPKLKDQILGLKVEQVKGSLHLKIHHQTEGLKDDHPDALANACWIAIRSGSVPVDATIIKPKTEDKAKSKGMLRYCKDCDEYHYENEECDTI